LTFTVLSGLFGSKITLEAKQIAIQNYSGNTKSDNPPQNNMYIPPIIHKCWNDFNIKSTESTMSRK
jgi:hypothetical protein